MRGDIVVDADWVAHRRGSVTPVDVREEWEFEGIGHLPDAVNVPFDAFRDRGADPPGTLPAPSDWATLLGDAGIEPDDTLVAYDDMHGVFAARFVVTALVFGHHDVHLLNGDYSSWVQAHETTTDPPTGTAVEYPTPTLDDGPLATADDVLAAPDEEGTILVDTRTPAEFEAGHIRGAVQLDWLDLVDDDTRGLKSVEELESTLADRGITADKRVVLYCNTARRLSHTYLVLRWLGFGDVSFYEGSLTEWEAAGREIVSE